MPEAQRFDPELRRALAELLEAQRAYVEAHAAWSAGPEEKRMLQRGAVEDAARRADEARREAARRG